jgi:hypothetical protein
VAVGFYELHQRSPADILRIVMTTRKTKLKNASRRATAIMEEHLQTLSHADAEAMRRDIHKLALKSSRPASRGKVSRVRRSAGSRPLSRASAKPSSLKNLPEIVQESITFRSCVFVLAGFYLEAAKRTGFSSESGNPYSLRSGRMDWPPENGSACSQSAQLKGDGRSGLADVGPEEPAACRRC